MVLLSMGCTRKEHAVKEIDLQGHRGCRGLLPENTIEGFIKALEIGVNTLELDVVISKDKKVVVSHEPYLSSEICLDIAGQDIGMLDQKSYNLYQMDYEEIAAYDCGSKEHPRFEGQEKMRTVKPLLSEAIKASEAYVKENGLVPVKYNIEIKSNEDGDGEFHPEPGEFVDLVVEVVKNVGILDRTNLQSFDMRALQEARKRHPKIPLALLIEINPNHEGNIEELGFIPEIYSCYYPLVNGFLLDYAAENNMKVSPWTVNDKETMEELILKGVDGIITDYPDRALEVLGR
jgi:glycerophosphoryl diester phosphodiesterase